MQKQNSTAEEWRPVPGWEGYYEVSSHGRVRSLDRIVRVVRRGRSFARNLRGRVLKPCAATGYETVLLCRYGTHNHRAVHWLVLETFVGPRPEGYNGCHNNGVKTDNYLSNLRWDTPVGNMADKVKHGTVWRAKGSLNGYSKLTESDIPGIRDLRAAGWSYEAIGVKYRIDRTAISLIIRGKRWAHVPDGSPRSVVT